MNPAYICTPVHPYILYTSKRIHSLHLYTHIPVHLHTYTSMHLYTSVHMSEFILLQAYKKLSLFMTILAEKNYDFFMTSAIFLCRGLMFSNDVTH